MTKALTTRSFPAHPASLRSIREFVRAGIEAAALDRASVEDIVLAVSEAAANAVLHSGSPRVRLTLFVSDQAVEIEVRDAGAFRRRVRMPVLEGPGGYGIPLMTALTDQVVIREGTDERPGTSVRLVKNRRRRA